MWGQLAGRISKIGDVVAPALSNDEEDDDEDEDYEDEGEEDEEDEGEYEEEGDEDEEENGNKPVVGFVGFLTRALDGAKHSSTPNKSHQQDSHQAFEHQQDDQEDEEEEKDVIDLDQQHSMQNSLFPHQLQQQQHQQNQQSSALSSTSNADENLVLIPAAKDIVASMTASPIPEKSALNVDSTANTELKKEGVGPPPSSEAKRPMQLGVPPATKPDSVKPTVTDTSQQPKLSAARTTQQQQSKPLSAKRLVVPSVATSTKLPSVAGSNQAPQVSALNSDEKGTSQSEENMENLSNFDDSIGQSQRQKPTPSTIRVSEIKEDVPREQKETSLKDQTSGKSSNHSRASDVENNSNLDEFKGLTRVDHKRTAQNVTNGSALPQAGVEEKVTAPTKSSDTNTPPPMESNAMEQPIAEIAKKPAAVSEPSSNDGSVTKPTLTLKQVDDSESSKSTSRVTDSAQEYTKLDVDSPPHMAATDNGDILSDELARWQAHCQQLESQLQQAQDKLLQSEQLVWEKEQQSEQQRQELMIKFQEKEMRLLEAANEDHQQELEQMRQDADLLCQSLQQQMEQERKMALQQQQQLSRLLSEAESRIESAEESKKSAVAKVQAELNQTQQRQKRSVQMAEDKLAQALAKLDERDEEIRKLKTTVSTLQSKMTQHQEGAQEAEEEMDELHTENETLQQHVQVLQEECTSLRAHVEELEAEAEKYSGLEVELKKMKEAYERERALTQSAAQNLESNHAQAESERDAAMAEMKNLQQQLAAALADVNVSRSDTERIMMANANLQNALEAFQSEREAEMALLEEQRHAAEEATAAAHAAALDAMRESNEAKMKEVSLAADKAIRNIMEEVNQLERRVEAYRKENVQLRRSLDEAIHQLQMNQEDVIDRTVMKNVLLEWFAMKGKKEKRQVLEMMASLLHFTEEEKEKIHIIAGIGTLSKVVGAVAAPLPPAASDHLDGNTVSEKWVNFLLAETDDGNASNER